MSTYTMTLKECLELWTVGTPTSQRDLVEKGRQQLFDFQYEIFDPNYKAVFETHFIRNFLFREIGFETEGRFKWELETWLMINMPFFNKLFESELKDFDPLINNEMSSTSSGTKKQDKNSSSTANGSSNATSTGTSASDSFNRNLESDNPDTRLAITTQDGKGVIEYAKSIDESTNTNSLTNSGESDQTSSSTSSGSSVINDTEDYLVKTIGKTGDQTYSAMMNEYRNSLIRVEKKIFNEMQELFMLVY